MLGSDSFKLSFDFCFGESRVFVGFLVAGIYGAVVGMVSVEMFDEYLRKVSGGLVSGLKTVDVVVGNKPAVEV